MPAGAALAPGAWPGGLARLGGLPERKVGRRLFARVHLETSSGQHLAHRAARELAVVGVAGDAKVDIASGGVGVSAVDQALDEGDDRGDCLGDARVLGGGLHVERLELAQELVGELRGELKRVAAELFGAGDHLVVDIGEVHDVVYGETAMLQVAADHIEDNRRHGVAYVGVVVGGNAADVHTHKAGLKRLEGLGLTAEAVVKLNHMLLHR